MDRRIAGAVAGPPGAEEIITKNGESYVALIDVERLDYCHRLERERIHLLLAWAWGGDPVASSPQRR